MNTKVATIEADRSVMEACVEMTYQNIGSLVVVEKGQVVGIFTERDLLKKAVYQGLDLQVEQIGRVMTSPVISVEPEELIHDIVPKMLQKNIRHLPVTKTGRLLGMISVKDLLQYYFEAVKKIKGK